MNETLIIVMAITILLILFLYYENRYSELTNVKSTIDNHEYLVRNKDDKIEAANLLAKMVGSIKKLINHLKEKNIFNRLSVKFNPENISESLSSSKYTSYSVNKGEKIVFCIRNKDSNESLVSLNTIMFVAIHELAHIETKSIGHTKEFWDNMKKLLKISIKLGIYTKENYRENPVEYCGIKITASPLKD
mgnify:FL=1